MVRSAAAISEHPLIAHAVGEVTGEVLERLGESPTVVCLFVEAHHTGAIDDIVHAVYELLRPSVLVGSTACGVIGQDREIEDVGAISLWAASGIAAEGIRIEPGEVMPAGGWEAVSGNALVMLADPFSVDAASMLDACTESRPGLPIHGGLASAASSPGGNRLILGSRISVDGAVGVALGGSDASSLVSQGCRPIGDPFVVTGVDGNVVTELGSRPPMERLRGLIDAASDDDRSRLANGLTVGVVIDEGRVEHRTGDFLIRSLLGADQESGAIAIGATVPVGTTLQFHVRDAEAATIDLLDHLRERSTPAEAALVFTCNGRGRHLFGPVDHDADAIHHSTASRATAGMFCAGEFGPIGRNNHLHGFTASALLLDRPGPF